MNEGLRTEQVGCTRVPLTTPRSGEFAQEVGMSPQHESVNQGGLPGLTAEVGVGDHLADWPEGCGAL